MPPGRRRRAGRAAAFTCGCALPRRCLLLPSLTRERLSFPCLLGCLGRAARRQPAPAFLAKTGQKGLKSPTDRACFEDSEARQGNLPSALLLRESQQAVA